MPGNLGVGVHDQIDDVAVADDLDPRVDSVGEAPGLQSSRRT
jgi:hypothetical protein